MNNLLRYTITAASLVLLTTMGRAQEMVISEYFNIVDVNAEWTELVVVSDNLNAVGWILTDANTGQIVRQGGPQFRDVPLWRNLRAGTIIVLWHRAVPAGYVTDDNPEDGYLELSARDSRYFTTYYFAAPDDRADLNIADGGDVLEIVRGDLSHVHALGHNKPTGAAYNAIQPPKVNFDSGSVGASRSNRVTGRTLGAYGVGISKDSVVAGFNDSRGLPNRWDLARTNQGVANINHWFWRETREPKWTGNPTVSLVSQTANSQTIEWTALEDPNPQDSTTGYLLLRDTLGFSTFSPTAIRDGMVISKGARLGSATVIDIRPTKLGRRLTDSMNIQCGVTYTYRVYGYRYRRDDLLPVTDDTTARGRQYTEKRWAESLPIPKSNPKKPFVQASRLQICPGDTVTISTTTTDAVRYEWSVDGVPVPVGGTTSIVVRATGTYRLVIRAADGCFATSDPVTITALPAPSVEITPLGAQTICPGDSVKITVLTNAASYVWLHDGAVIPGETSNTYVAKSEGDYQVRIATSQGCPGLSSIVRVRYLAVKARIQPQLVDFGVIGQCKADTTVEVELINEGQTTFTVTNASFPQGFALVSPAPGFQVAAGKRQLVRLVYSPSGPGVTTGVATFLVQPCSVPVQCSLRGQRTAVSVALNKPGVDFGTFAACPNGVIRPDSSFCISNSGTEPIIIGVPRVDPPFFLVTQFPGPVTIAPGTQFCITVTYRPLGADRDRGVIQTIAFPYTSVSCQDTLRARVQGAAYRPTLVVDEPSIDVGIVLSCSRQFDTVVSVSNTSLVPVTVMSVTGNDITYSGGPVTIDPKTSRLLPVTVSPTGVAGAFSREAKIALQPCGDTIRATFEGVLLDAVYTSNRTEIDFGTVVLCEQSTKTLPFTISAKGLSGLRSRLQAITVDAPFDVSVSAGQSFTDSLQIDVTFNPPAEGVFIDTLSYVLDPCSIAQTVIVRGVAANPKYTASISSADFGLVPSGSSSLQTLSIVNTGSVDITISDVEGLIAPFTVISRRPALPTTLAPSEKVEIDIEYVFIDFDRRDTSRIVLRTLGACPDSSVFVLTGGTPGKGTITGLRVIAPVDVQAEAGTVVDLPLRLTSATPLDEAKLLEMRIDLQYDPRLMKPESIVANLAGAVASFQEISPGVTTIRVLSTSGIVEANPLVTLRARTYVAAQQSTVLDIDTAEAVGTIITNQDGRLTVVGDCEIQAGTVGVGRPIVFTAHHGTSRDVIRIEYSSLTTDPVTVSVISLAGEVVDQRVLPAYGTDLRSLEIPIQHLGSGTYTVRYHHGRHVRTIPLLIVR